MGINPGNPAYGMPKGEDSIVRQIADLRREARENLASVADSFKTTVADLRQAQDNLANLVSNQVSPSVMHVDAGNFGLTSSTSELVRATMLVPSGYTRALVTATSGVSARNQNTGFSIDMSASIDINGTTGGRLTQVTVPELSFGMVTSGASTLLTEVSGSIYVRVLALIAGATFAADPKNAVNLDVTALFLR